MEVRPPLSVFLCLLIVYLQFVICKDKIVFNNRFKKEDVLDYDPMRLTQCDAKCWTTNDKNCQKQCLGTNFEKLGGCPSSFENVSVFAQACVYACESDIQCSGIDKCCIHSCGRTCQTATGLEDYDVLPPIPTNITVREIKGKNNAKLDWSSGDVNPILNNTTILYLVEERHHIGHIFNKDRLNQWSPIHRLSTNSWTMLNVLKPGRWYQFRVAAVNHSGSKGYSKASKHFSFSSDPARPGKPRKLRVVKVQKINETVQGEFRWNPGKSDMPIQKYKVFWSRRLKEFRPSNVSGLVHVNQKLVSKDHRRYQLQNLETNTLYFIQVQAISSYGRLRLKSEKAAMVFNTTYIQDQYDTHKSRKD